ncbi:MAG: hypothetical protein IAE99_04100 [Rhodothermales bacterium]|nr:hypothetical protein [Rhodothermales bacterium]
MTDTRSADYTRARDAFAALPLDEKLGFLFDASMLTVARSIESVGECLSDEFSELATNLRGEVRKAADAMESFADEAAGSVRDAATRAEAFADDLAAKTRAAAASTARSESDSDEANSSDDSIEPTEERASDEVEKMLDDLFGPEDDEQG